MILSALFANARTLAAATAAVFLSVSPAYANSSATADVVAPLRTAQAAKPSALGSGDAEFRKIFSDWRSLEQVQPVALAAAVVSTAPRSFSAVSGVVSIPSRMPVDGVHLSSGYGMRTHPVLGGRRAHKGIDLAGPTGTPVYATADAVVSRAEWFSSYGLYIQLEHGAQIETRYGHLSRLAVAAGQRVRKGELIGFVGSTGRSTGPHLHYEVRIAGEAVNPLPYMQATTLAAAKPPLAIGGGPDED